MRPLITAILHSMYMYINTDITQCTEHSYMLYTMSECESSNGHMILLSIIILFHVFPIRCMRSEPFAVGSL